MMNPEISELLDFVESEISTYDREHLMPGIRAFAAHLGDVPTVKEMDPDFAQTEDTIVDTIYDQRHLLARPAQKWYDPAKRTTKKIGICIHHTAVKGGFGVHHKTVQAYDSEAHRPGNLREGRICHWDQPGNTWIKRAHQIAPDEMARLHALGARYRGQKVGGSSGKGLPYHAISGPNSVLYLHLPFDWVTWHGNGANSKFLGYAWDGNSLKQSADRTDTIEDLINLAAIMRSEGHRCDELTVHSAWTSKPHDPGEEFISDIMIPAAEAIGATINLEFSNGRGKPIAETLETR